MNKYHALNKNSGGKMPAFTHVIPQTGEIYEYRNFSPRLIEALALGKITEPGTYRPSGWFSYDEITLTVGTRFGGYQFAALRIWDQPLASMHAALSPLSADFILQKVLSEREVERDVARKLLTAEDAELFKVETEFELKALPRVSDLFCVSNVYPAPASIPDSTPIFRSYSELAPCLFWFLVQRHLGHPIKTFPGI